MNNNNTYVKTCLINLKESLSNHSWDQFLVATIENLMTIERENYLKNVNGIDKGNGFYSRALQAFSKNNLRVLVPRSRSGNFYPNMLELFKIGQEQVNELCLELYKIGVSSRDISNLVGKLFSKNLSATTVTNLAKTFNKFREAWHNSKLEEYYKVIFCDCLFITVRRGDSYAKEAVYVAYGVRNDNKRELVALNINPTEGASVWGEILENLKNKRGVKDIGLIVADGISYLEDEIHKHFPNAKFQKCVVHKYRNVLKKVRTSDKKEIAEDLKEVFNNFSENDTTEKAKIKLEKFIQKWKTKYPHIGRYFKEGNIEYYFTYINFDTRVRKMIYTSNSIENLNRAIRKATKNKLSFENPESLLDYLFMVIKEFEEKNYMKYPVYGYKYF